MALFILESNLTLHGSKVQAIQSLCKRKQRKTFFEQTFSNIVARGPFTQGMEGKNLFGYSSSQ
jgi:hypothetical protein